MRPLPGDDNRNNISPDFTPYIILYYAGFLMQKRQSGCQPHNHEDSINRPLIPHQE